MEKLMNLSTKAYVKGTCMLKGIKSKIRDFINEERGASDILALIIIIGIVLTIGFLFRTQLIKLVKDLWNALIGSDGSDFDQENITNWN